MDIALKTYFPHKHDSRVIAQGYACTEDGARAFIKLSHGNGATCNVLIRTCKGSTLTVNGDEDLDVYCCTIGLNTVERMSKQALRNVVLSNDSINELTMFAI